MRSRMNTPENISRQLRERERLGRPKRSPEEQAKLNDWHRRVGESLVKSLNHNVSQEREAKAQNQANEV